MNTNEETAATNEIEPTQNRDLLFEKEAADYLKISISTIKRKRSRKEIAFFKLGHGIRYSIADHLQPFLRYSEVPVDYLEDESWH